MRSSPRFLKTSPGTSSDTCNAATSKHIVPFVHLIHGVESEGLMTEIQKRAVATGRTVDVLLQVFIAQEETKHGLSPVELRAALNDWPWRAWPNVRVRG